ncbi:MAG: phage baseplate assembly protein V [Gemmataceae bacterium]|nr:phage baseplate assembly protein V [Gemmataceae bacterium]
MDAPDAERVEHERLSTGLGGLWPGVYPALVTDVRDPDGQGRVKISLPWSPDPKQGGYAAWARVATLMAGPGRGTWVVPDPGDEVLVAFEGGHPERPYVLGALWNGRDAPPESMDEAGRNARKVIRTRSGLVIALDDTGGTESVTISTPGGQKFALKDGPSAVEILDGSGNSVKLEAGGITIQAASVVTISAGQVNVSAGQVTVSAGMSKFSGVVQADTVITNTIVAATYTPGAGNIW